MDWISVIAIVISAATLAVLLWVIRLLRANQQETPETSELEVAMQSLKSDLLNKQTESMLALRQSLDNANQLLNSRLAEGTSSLDRRMAVLGDIQDRLGRLTTQIKHIEEIGKSIRSLSELLRPPKLRGQLGEMFLENLLGEILPKAMYEIQHRFPSGTRVDAAIKMGDRLIPIDAKFPMEAFERLRQSPDDQSLTKEFNRVLKKHCDAIADKYIRPQDGTTDFALMYIPAEAVYYHLISQQSAAAFDYALSRRVVPSSPGHLYTFLASLAATYSEFAVVQAGLVDGGRKLVASLRQLSDSTEKIAGFHDKMEGSMRMLSGNIEKSRQELTAVRRELASLVDPFDENGESSDNTTNGELF